MRVREVRILDNVPSDPLELLTQDGLEPPPEHIKKEFRNKVTSDLHPDPCENRYSSAPDASPAANEPVGNKRTPSLTEATPLAPICAPPHPDESRRGDLKEQTPCTTRAVLTTPFDADAHQMLPACWRMSRLSSQGGPVGSPLPLPVMFRGPQTRPVQANAPPIMAPITRPR